MERKQQESLICCDCWKKECCNQGHNFVYIDTSILDEIIQLNLKGYSTKFCCGGHVSSSKNLFMPPSMYIMFQNGVKLPSIPKGFVYLDYYNQIQATCLFCGNVIDEQKWLYEKRENLKEWITSL